MQLRWTGLVLKMVRNEGRAPSRLTKSAARPFTCSNLAGLSSLGVANGSWTQPQSVPDLWPCRPIHREVHLSCMICPRNAATMDRISRLAAALATYDHGGAVWRSPFSACGIGRFLHKKGLTENAQVIILIMKQRFK